MASKSSWVVLSVAGVLTAASVGTLIYSHDAGAGQAAPATTSSASTSSAVVTPSQESATGSTPPAPGDGCLGGTDTGKGLLQAEASAPLDASGAATFALAYTRWAGTYPVTTPPSVIGPAVWASDASPNVKQAGKWRNPPAGARSYIATVDAYTLVESMAGDSAVVSVASRQTASAPGENAKVKNIASTLYLRAVEGHWRLVDTRAIRTAEEIAIRGIPAKNGC